MSEIKQKLIDECKRQEEACLYTSTTLFIWLKRARWYNRIFIALPIIFAGISTMSVLQEESYVWVTATFALLAGIIPAIYEALDFKVNVGEISNLAAEFKNLQDRFRQAAEIESLKEETCFNDHVEMLLQRLEIARERSITPPEWCFEEARKKIKAGHYDFLADGEKARHD
jgi:hypothetical protein